MWCHNNTKAHFLNNVTYKENAKGPHERQSPLPIPTLYLKTPTTLNVLKAMWHLHCACLITISIHLSMAADCLFSFH